MEWVQLEPSNLVCGFDRQAYKPKCKRRSKGAWHMPCDLLL